MKPRAADEACGHILPVALSPARRKVALSAAEARCVAAGETWSASRCRTYELLLEAQKPCAAYDLISRFAAGGRPPGPPTIYRALECLVRLGVVHRIEAVDKFIACAQPGFPHAAPAFLICECCGRAEEQVAPGLAGQLGLGSGFLVRHMVLELTGRCPACQAPPQRPCNVL